MCRSPLSAGSVCAPHAPASPAAFTSCLLWSRPVPAPQLPASEKTPAWCGPESLKEAAGPKSWRGVGQALEDWGELNTGEQSHVEGRGGRVGQVLEDWGELNTTIKLGPATPHLLSLRTWPALNAPPPRALATSRPQASALPAFSCWT